MTRALILPAAITLALYACTGDALSLPSDGDPQSIEALAGNAQNGLVGGALPESLVVRVTDAHDRPIPGQPVEFILTADPTGQVLPDTVITDASGRAAARWQLGIEAGVQQAKARVVGAPTALAVTFIATADPAPPDSLELVSGDNQFAQIGSVLPDSLVVQLIDQFGNPIPGADIQWSAQNGNVSSSVTTTDGNGRAAVEWTLGFFPGTQQATAGYSGAKGSPVTFVAGATVGP